MRKLKLLLVITLSFATFFGNNLNSWAGTPAPIKVGNSCITPNQKVNQSGTQLICKNINQHLNQWIVFSSAGKDQSNSKSSTQPVPSTVDPTCNPQSKNFGNNFPTSFSDLYAKRAQISCSSWSRLNSSFRKIATQPSALPPVDLEVGPNTHPQDPTTQELNLINNLFAGPGVFKKITIIYFDPTDMQWATDLARKLMGDNEVQRQFLAEPNANPRGVPLIHCITNGQLNCDAGDAWVTSDGQAFLGLGVPDQPYNNIGNGMSIAAVEYYHSLILNPYVQNNSLQFATSTTNGQDALSAINNLPQWLGVSGENFVNIIATEANSYSNYRNDVGRDLWNQAQDISSNMNGIASAYGTNFNITWINKFLDISNADTKWRSNYLMNQVGYKLGTRISEMLVALKGPTIFTQLDNLMAQGKSYDQAFQSIFGTSWESAQPTIAKILWDEYSHN